MPACLVCLPQMPPAPPSPHPLCAAPLRNSNGTPAPMHDLPSDSKQPHLPACPHTTLSLSSSQPCCHAAMCQLARRAADFTPNPHPVPHLCPPCACCPSISWDKQRHTQPGHTALEDNRSHLLLTCSLTPPFPFPNSHQRLPHHLPPRPPLPPAPPPRPPLLPPPPPPSVPSSGTCKKVH